MNRDIVISVRGARKTYRTPYAEVKALAGADLDIERGSFFGLVGFSGAGKSTLLRCMNRLESLDAGSLSIDGRETTELAGAALVEHRRRVGMIFQQFNLFDSRTVAGNIAFPLEIAGVGDAESKRRVEELAELVGLTDKLGDYPGALSGGQKQRVGIARALAGKPDVLLSDEATSALDPSTTVSILELLRRLNRELGLTVVMVSHELDVVRSVCSRMAVLDAGRVVETGTVEDVFDNPLSLTAKRFVGITKGFQDGNIFRNGAGI